MTKKEQNKKGSLERVLRIKYFPDHLTKTPKLCILNKKTNHKRLSSHSLITRCDIARSSLVRCEFKSIWNISVKYSIHRCESSTWTSFSLMNGIRPLFPLLIPKLFSYLTPAARSQVSSFMANGDKLGVLYALGNWQSITVSFGCSLTGFGFLPLIQSLSCVSSLLVLRAESATTYLAKAWLL